MQTRLILLAIVSFMAVRCTSLKLPEKVEIVLKGQPGQSTETRYYSNSRTYTYASSQLVRDRSEIVDFTVRTDFTDYRPEERRLAFTAQTVRKDGTVDLHELAFPELKEKIDYVVDSVSGRVFRAGNYSSMSVFFVPTLPLPQRPVAVGDTWVMEHNWVSNQDRIPLHLQVIGILKGLAKCEDDKNHLCADVEISGGLNLLNVPLAQGPRFENRISGRVLFDLDRGDVLTSEVRSREEVVGALERAVIDSCMVSALQTDGKRKQALSCQP